MLQVGILIKYINSCRFLVRCSHSQSQQTQFSIRNFLGLIDVSSIETNLDTDKDSMGMVQPEP